MREQLTISAGSGTAPTKVLHGQSVDFHVATMSSVILKPLYQMNQTEIRMNKTMWKVLRCPSSLILQMANDSTETSEAGEEEEDHEGDNENKERMPFIQ